MKRKLHNVGRYVCLALAFLFVFLSSVSSLNGQSIDKLEQAANGRLSNIDDPVTWVTGNVNSSKAHYTEGMTIPYHVQFSGLVVGEAYCFEFGWDTKKGGKHAIDYLTSYDADVVNNHFNVFEHTAEVIDPPGCYRFGCL